MRKKLSIALPASAISDTPHLREKTSKIGLIGRAAAIFRVNEIIVYAGSSKTSQLNDSHLMTTLLAYMETPQYLRKRLFKLDPQLQYAGILPPLRTPHHPLYSKSTSLKVGEYREGVVLARNKDGLLLDIGVDKPVLMRENTSAIGTRLTTRVVREGEHVEVENSDRDQIQVYWGYKVSAHERPITGLFNEEKFDLTIATSKFGTRYADVAEKLASEWTKAKSVLVAFGAPAEGLFEIARDEGANLNDQVDFVVNTIPNQGTDTVRTEEAVLGALAIFNTRFEW
jgi:methyltransferase